MDIMWWKFPWNNTAMWKKTWIINNFLHMKKLQDQPPPVKSGNVCGFQQVLIVWWPTPSYDFECEFHHTFQRPNVLSCVRLTNLTCILYSAKFSRSTIFVVVEVCPSTTLKIKPTKFLHTALAIVWSVIHKNCFSKIFQIAHLQKFSTSKICHYTVF